MTYKKKLIEIALPLVAISEAGAREQSIKRGKPTQLHKWFAARPMVTTRAMLWASLITDPSSRPTEFPTEALQEKERHRLFEILRQLVQWENSRDVHTLEQAQRELHREFGGELPTVIDPFAGGGTTPLEALRLGLSTISSDLNPVPTLLQHALLDLPYRFSNTQPINQSGDKGLVEVTPIEALAQDIEHYGEMVRERAARALSSHFELEQPNGNDGQIVAWIWVRTVRSPDPSFPHHVPLATTWVLKQSKSGKPPVHVRPTLNESRDGFVYEVLDGGPVAEPTMVGRGKARCLATGATISSGYIKEQAAKGLMSEQLIAVLRRNGRNRSFESVVGHDTSVNYEDSLWRPSGPMSSHPQYMGPPRYGMDDWWKLFNPRQLLANTTIADLVRDIHAEIQTDAVVAGLTDDAIAAEQGGRGARAYADAVCTYLAFVVDRLVDWNNSCCGWDNKNFVNQHLFTRQAIPMLWDYCEILPYGDTAGSFGASLKTITTALRSVPTYQIGQVVVRQMDASASVGITRNVVVSTDPPYYDVVPYADISDFFYMWLKRMIGGIWPDMFSTIVTPKEQELVADSQRHGSKEKARDFFENGMTMFMRSTSDAQRDDIPMTIYYAYKATEYVDGAATSSGWDTFLQSIVDAGMMVTSTWPVRTENKSRLRALNSNALATSVVLSVRRRPSSARIGTKGDLISELRSVMPSAINEFQTSNVLPVDLQQAAIGIGMAAFSSFSKVLDSEGMAMPVRTALSIINQVLSEILMGDDVDLDGFTQFALAWFEQFGFGPAESGLADQLAQSKNISIDAVIMSGIGYARGGQFRLYDRSGLDSQWSPESDSILTVWEMTQHLLVAFDASDSAAAELLAQVGESNQERVKRLAYLMFSICERRGMNEEASRFNSLVTQWEDLIVESARRSDDSTARVNTETLFVEDE